MPKLERDDVSIYYEEYGSPDAFPVLTFAPGGMRSSIHFWQKVAPWDPTRELARDFRVIAMDQRNAGQSVAPIRGSDGWPVYTADHLALLDHLRIERCHLVGGCIGGAFSLALIDAAPARVASAVLQQTIGLGPDNRAVFYKLFDDWAAELEATHSNVPASDWASFRENMYGGEFVFSVGPSAVRGLQTPLLVLLGNDVYHPSATSREVAALAAHAELVERWKDPETLPETVQRVREFLIAHTPPEKSER